MPKLAQPSPTIITIISQNRHDIIAIYNTTPCSNIPSENSSAYVTPYSTRSQSPVPQEISNNGAGNLSPLSTKDPSSSLDSQSSIERVRDSLQKLLDLRLAPPGSSSSSSTVELDDTASPTSETVDRCLESCDSQVTILGSLVKDEGSSTKSTPCSITFTHPSSVFDIEDEEDRNSQASNHSPLPEFRTRPRCLSKDISNIFIGEMELEVSSDGEDADSAVDFVSRSRSPSSPLHEEDNDSGCATSIGSPDKITSSLDFKRPGILHVPEELLLQIEDTSKDGERTAKVQGDSVLNQEENSSLDLSGHDEILSEREKQSQKERVEGRGDDDSESGKDEWPDLFAEESSMQSASGCSNSNNNASTTMFNYPGVPLSMQQPPSVNGFVNHFPFPPMPPSSTGNNNKTDSDPSQIMASINSHVRQQQQAVYQQHQMLFSSAGYPMGPPPPPGPHHIHGHMFPGGPTGFMGFFPPHLPPPPPPPGPFPLGPAGYPHPLPPPPPPHPIGADFLALPPPTSMAPPIQPPSQPRPLPSQSPAGSISEEDTQGIVYELC